MSTECTMGEGLETLFPFDLNFRPEGPNKVSTTFIADKRLQGYKGIIHGGILAALLDTAMARCLQHKGIHAVTGALNVRFFEPVACDAVLKINAWIDDTLPPLYQLKADIVVAGKRACRATAKFMQKSV